MNYGMDYRMQPYPPDGWDIAKALSSTATALSIALLFTSSKKSKETLGTISSGLGLLTTVVHIFEPPRCPTCLVRPIKNDTHWICPNCGSITGKIIQAGLQAALQAGIERIFGPISSPVQVGIEYVSREPDLYDEYGRPRYLHLPEGTFEGEYGWGN